MINYDEERLKLAGTLMAGSMQLIQNSQWQFVIGPNEAIVEADGILAAGGYTREAAPEAVEPTEGEWDQAFNLVYPSWAGTRPPWELSRSVSAEAYRLASERAKGVTQ